MMALPLSTGEKVPSGFDGGQAFTIPVSLLLRLYNELPADSAARNEVAGYVQAYGAANPKAHWTRAVVKSPAGALIFDEARFRRAVYRGKQETYLASAEEAFATLRRSLDAVSRNQTSELSALASDAALLPGEALLQIADYSEQARLARGISGAIKNAVGEMQPTLVGQISQHGRASETLAFDDTVHNQGDKV